MTGILESPAVRTTESRGLRSFFTVVGIGARLAVRGGRQGWTRLLLTAGGFALCTIVLLIGTSTTTAMTARQSRAANLAPFDNLGQTRTLPPGAPTFEVHQTTVPWGDRMINGNYVAPVSGVPPLPPGLSAYPGVGDLVVSPALQELLNSGDSALRRLVPGRIVGLIADAGLTSPTELRYYAGMAPTEGASFGTADSTGALNWTWGNNSYWTGGNLRGTDDSVGPYLQLLVTAGAALVLVPLAIFVLIISRLGSAGRAQRLAAIRLVGGSRSQVHGLIAGETLVAAVLGVVIGGGGFLVARLGARWLFIGGDGFFPSDLRPPIAAAVAVIVGLPLIAVAATVLGAGRMMADPLSAAQGLQPPAPRLLWRLSVVAIAIGAMALVNVTSALGATFGLIAFAGSVMLVLLVVPVALPWLLRVALIRVRPRGPLATQLAIRHLQVDSTTSARVVSGAATVLAGAIALQYLVGLMDANAVRTVSSAHNGSFLIHVDAPTPSDIAAIPARIKSIGSYSDIRGGAILQMKSTAGQQFSEAFIGTCEQIEANLGIANCRDGDAFRLDDGGSGTSALNAGSLWTPYDSGDSNIRFTIPDTIRNAQIDPAKVNAFDFAPNLALTIGSLGPNDRALLSSSFIYLLVRPTVADSVTLKALRVELGDLTWRADVSSFSEVLPTSGRLQLAATIRLGLIVAGLLTLVVSATGLVLVAVEDLNRRHRALTLLVAAGVPRATVGRSLIVGSAIPAVLGTVLAIVVGVGLSAYLQARTTGTVRIEPGTVALYSTIGLIAILTVTACTLPAVRRMTRPESLRTE